MIASNLSADWLTAWQQEITATLETILRSFEDTFGYPPGDNEVFLADEESRAAAARLKEVMDMPRGLTSLYAVIAELSLPDIDHGYFVHTPAQILDDIDQYGHVRVTAHATGVVFGSDGGGILFALDSDGRVHRSTTASWSDDFEVYAPTLVHFLEQLRQAVTAFARR
ncbi:hypothetical protein [Streptomyces sp. NPDC029674]|uniref:hypothetical protein n=1 Tax=Streptomyces sp. NPDC029674 TaxID=3365297 RepID=UPI00384F067A